MEPSIWKQIEKPAGLAMPGFALVDALLQFRDKFEKGNAQLRAGNRPDQAFPRQFVPIQLPFQGAIMTICLRPSTLSGQMLRPKLLHSCSCQNQNRPAAWHQAVTDCSSKFRLPVMT